MRTVLLIAYLFLLYACTESDTPVPNQTPAEQEVDTTSENGTEDPETADYSIQGDWTTTSEQHTFCQLPENQCSVESYTSINAFWISRMECTSDSVFFYNENAPDNLYGKYSYETLDSVTFAIDLGPNTLIYGIFQINWSDSDHLSLTNEFYNEDSSYFFSDIYFLNRDQ
ncbi:hypothetical protein [Marinoscillum luteum]|uniref:Lipocalin-like domain-containing protein n=1 Tax=Marinoscillum luteum TaxID=861051 RepID=A0ABW7NC90_9BACT